MNRNKRTTISLPSDREVLITRHFDAPRELVFRAHTDPALIPLWWGPGGTTTIVDQMDVRPGGKYRFIHSSEDVEYVFSGEFREVVPYERLVQTSEFDGAPGHVVLETLIFEEVGGKTTLRVLDLCETKEDRDAILASGMDEGLNESYDRLAQLVAEQGTPAHSG
jgi:uncharacterized protein YndB with AHSA1/START domain